MKDEQELKKIGQYAKVKANCDPDIIRLWTRYHDKVQYQDNFGNKKKADELAAEWAHIFKGFVQLLLPRDLTDEEHDYIVDYLFKEKDGAL